MAPKKPVKNLSKKITSKHASQIKGGARAEAAKKYIK